MLVLVVVIRRVHENSGTSNVNLIAIEVQELHEDVAVMLLWIHGSRLDLGHGLQDVCNQANGGESPDTATENFIDPTHDQELLDESDEDWHGRVVFLPSLERLECREARVVLERDVDFNARTLIGELHNRHFGPTNKSGRVRLRDSKPLDMLSKAAQLILGLANLTGPAALERFGKYHKVHVRSGQVKP